MGKYDPLKTFLQSQRTSRVPMTFSEIETLLDLKLPKSKQYPAWWSNSPTNNVMTQVWLDAGFVTEQVDVSAERLVFRKAEAGSTSSPSVRAPTPQTGVGMLERIRAALGGTVRFAPGFDPTAPTGEEWDAERR